MLRPFRDNRMMRISARADYAVRAALDLARHDGDDLRSADSIAESGDIPPSFLEAILASLRKSGLVESKRGASGGYRLALPPASISVGDVIRAVDGPLVFVRDARPSDLQEAAMDESLLRLWVALRASVRNVLDATTLAQLASGTLPDDVEHLLSEPSSWLNAPVGVGVRSD